MQSTNFVVLTGHLNDYPLTDLIGILRHQRKTGRLLIEYAISPCSFYFVDGNLVDAQLNKMSGLQAVLVALSQPNASFNFNPLIQPPRRSINESSQKVVLELLGCWDEPTIDVEATTGNGFELSALPPAIATQAETAREALPEAKEILALPPSSLERASVRRSRHVLLASAIISLIISFVMATAFTRWMIKRDISAALSEFAKNHDVAGSNVEVNGANAQTVKVLVQVEGGRVSRASIKEHRAGLEAYEALALRIARQRHYPANTLGQDTVAIKINPPQ